MQGLEGIISGFSLAISPENLVACFIGVLLGTIVGVLPGLGPTATMALLLPITLNLDPVTGIIMLAGIWYGCNYGGSTTSILVNIPGEASTVMTAIEGYQMSRKGRAGAALAIAAVGSFVAGTMGIIGLQFFAPPLAKAALAFGPIEYLALMIFAFVLLTNLTGSSPVKGLLMASVGFWLGTVGTDPITSVNRFTLGHPDLMAGIDFLPIAMGLFGIAEIISVAVEKYQPQSLSRVRFRDLYPTREEAKRSVKPILRGSILGFFVGLVPGPAPTISTFLSYSLEKRLAKKYKDEFGRGAIEGVAGPESANNSAVTGAFVPLLAVGIPFAPSAAILLAALRMHQIEAGPILFQTNPHVFWGVVASMYVGNVMLLVLNLPLVGLFARIASLKPHFLMPVVSVLCLIGVYSVRNSIFDIWIMLIAGIIGFFLRKKNYPVAPLILGLVLGPKTEVSFRNGLTIMEGSLWGLFTHPISAVLMIATIIFILVMLVARMRGAKSGAFVSSESEI